MSTYRIILVVLSVGILGEFTFLPMANAQSDFSIVSSNDYADSFGQVHIIGEVQNDSDNVVTLVQIEATLFDENDQVIDRPSGRVFVDFIRPGEKSAFHLVFFDSEQSSNISRYEIHVISEITGEDKPRMLEVSVGEGYVDEMGRHHVVGEVKNNGDAAATFIEVSAAMYDSNGNVVDAISGSTVPQSILPGEAAQFDILSIAPEAAATSTVSVNVQSAEYANVPEFPTAVLIIVGAVMSMIILLGRRNWLARFH